MRAPDVEVSASAGRRVDMNSHAKAAGFDGDESENIILKRLIVAGAGGIVFVGIGLRGIAHVERSQVGHLELFGDRSRLFVAFERGANHFIEIFVERGGFRGYSGFGVIPLQQLVFEREKRFLVGVVYQRIGRQRIHQGVGKRDPQESRRRQTGAERDSIGQHRFDIQLVEHAHRVIASVCSRGLGFIASKHRAMSFDQLGRPGAIANRIGLRFERLDRQSVVLGVGLFAIERRTNRMGVIIDSLDACDPGSKLRIDAFAFRRGPTRREDEEQRGEKSEPGGSHAFAHFFLAGRNFLSIEATTT